MKKVPVSCRNIRLSYGRTPVLKDVSLDIHPGEFFALLGPSGSGKSTLLRLVAGFSEQQGGELLIDGVEVSRRAPWERDVGMVFQNYALWPHLSVRDNVAFGLVERRVGRVELKRRVAEALDLVGLGDYGERRPGQLSGGQQQRVALARTLVIEPKVLLLDEPLSNLDRTLRVQMRQEILALQRRLGLTTLFVTHDQEEAMTTADRMAVLDQGVLQQVGTPEALYDEPANAFVAQFVGTMNLLPARVVERRTAAWTVDVPGIGPMQVPLDATAAAAAAPPRSDDVHLSVRPHALAMALPEGPLDDARTWMPGTVEAGEFQGGFTRYRVRLAQGSTFAVDQPHDAGHRRFDVGTAVRLGVRASQVRLLPR